VKKRYRERRAKPGELRAYFGKADGDGPDVCFANGEGVDRASARLLHNALNSLPVCNGRSLLDELKARGFDIETLQFSIRKAGAA
jgi:hypothetical protein